MLNKNQERVVNCKGVNPLLVEAGPGSGKTLVIVERIKFLLKNAEPETFLVITFSRKAAKQLKDRLYEELPKEVVDKMQISTIHSFCLDFLAKNGVNVSLIDDDNSERKELFLRIHRKELGFVNEFTIRNYKPVISKFREYTIFDVDTDKLVSYIEENKPYSQEYVDFVNSLGWFKKKIIQDNEFGDDWYNAKYLQVARAYPIYLDLLERYSYVDYDTLQKKTLDLLEKDYPTFYTNILIDEFQDTDPIQARIFRKLLDKSESFMAVGDIDQRIYFFRGAYGDYFDEFSKDYNVDVYPLNINYRSSNEIVDVSDGFIKNKRGEYSHKKLEAYRNISNDSYILSNESPEEEASNIFNFIKYLDNNKIVDKFSDIAILNKSVLNSKTLTILIESLRNENIPVNVQDFSDLSDKNEVKSIIVLLYYITRRVDATFSHKVEREWGGLKAFNGEEFEPTMWCLSDSTKDYLTSLEDEFNITATETEATIIKEHELGKRKSKNLARIFANRDEDFIDELFKRIKRPIIDLDKITDKNDREFFTKLNEIRDSINVEEDKPSILDVYYQLLDLGGYFKEDILNNDEYSNSLQNLATLTKTIENYENYYSKDNVSGLLSFLTRVIEDYSSSEVSDDGIQIMTVHKAKGLEFPVTIVASLEKEKFPSIPNDPTREKNYIVGDDTFYTPNVCLNYKNTSEEEDNELESLEGIRVVYVAMTRAQDILLLSTVGEVPDEIAEISHLLKEFDLDNLTNKKVEIKVEHPKEEKLTLSYSTFDTYNNCPLKYKLVNTFEFKSSSSEKADLGSLIHRSLDAINHKLKLNGDIEEEEVIEICQKIFISKYDLVENSEEFDDFCDDVLDYLDDFLDNDLEVVDSEVPFSIEFDDFILKGAIDLIYKDGNEIKVLDYKNTEYKQSNMSKYKTQLLTYILALENDPSYKQYNINSKSASIYTLQSNKLSELNIDEDNELSEQLENMKNAAININNNCFESNKSIYCNICEFKPYCESGKDG